MAEISKLELTFIDIWLRHKKIKIV